MPRRLPEWRALVAPAALSVFVATLGFLPYLEFDRNWGSLEAFKSAFDEDTYLLGDIRTPHRFLSEAAVDVIDFLTPGLTGLMIAMDVVVPVLVVIAAWLLVTRLIKETGPRILCVLLLLFGQELFSLANSIVWPDREIVDLRQLRPPTTLKLFPDATTSYFTLFRTPEPAVSWVVLFAFLALVSDRDPLAAFEGKRRRLTYPIFAVLGFAYPFTSIPIILITVVVFGWALLHDRSRVRAVGMALVTAAASYLLATFITALDDSIDKTSLLFSSRVPILTPALAAGTLVAILFLLIHRAQTLRRLELLIPFAAALLPVAICNQQLLTGIMVSARDWERNTNYALVIFALICLFASVKSHSPARSHLPNLRLAAWIAIVYLGVQLIGWQRDVYSGYESTNVEAHETAELLDGLSGPSARYPVVLENAGLTPLVRLLTNDPHSFVLDYTRLFLNPVPSFADGNPTDQPGPHRDELFAHAYRLGWRPARLEEQIRSELEGDANAFYAHFLFALTDVWPPLTDDRRLQTKEALERLPNITAAYLEYLEHQAHHDPGPTLVVTERTPLDADDGRNNELVATASRSSRTTPPLHVYVQTFDRSGTSLN
jgi:hypothetical protein